MLGSLVCARLIRLATHPNPKPCPTGPGLNPPPTHPTPHPSHLAQVIKDLETLWEVPHQPRGVLFVAHGCSHSGSDWWPPSQRCQHCLGLPEEMIVRRAVRPVLLPFLQGHAAMPGPCNNSTIRCAGCNLLLVCRKMHAGMAAQRPRSRHFARHSTQAVERGYAVIAVSSFDRETKCWHNTAASRSEDLQVRRPLCRSCPAGP